MRRVLLACIAVFAVSGPATLVQSPSLLPHDPSQHSGFVGVPDWIGDATRSMSTSTYHDPAAQLL